jgi:hypothetical protein
VTAGDRLGENTGVLRDTQERRGLPLALEMHAHEVQTRDDRARSVSLDGEALLVERLRAPDPAGVVRPESGREDHRAEPIQCELIALLRDERLRRRDLWCLDAPLDTRPFDHGP